MHPKTLCQDGYGNNGIDSPNSLSDVWLAVDSSPGLDSTVRSAAATGNFWLYTDREVIDDLKRGSPQNWMGFRQPGIDERYQPTSIYLTSPKVRTPFPAEHPYGERLRVIIMRTGPVSLMCGGNQTIPGQYTTPPERAVLELYLTAED